ncbi:MAG: hypothetical protein JST70_04810 [Bacteroidetes bacterium]|nr:hypothetical protein [Bacteroidota bacterium]
MAIDISPLLTDHNARPYHLSVVADIYSGQDEDTYYSDALSTTRETAKTSIHTDVDDAAADVNIIAAIAAINSIIDAAHAAGSFDETVGSDLKTDIAAAINANISFDATALKTATDTAVNGIPVTINKSDVLNRVKVELDDYISSDTTNFPYVDVWCQGAGRYEKYRDAGADPGDTSLKHCDVCDGFGRKPTQGEIIVIKPATTIYPQ